MSASCEQLCACGCGQPTTIYRGVPRRFVHGHHARKYPHGWDVVDTGHATPCWLWHGAKTARGYAKVRCEDGRISDAHRVIYEKRVGPVPAGLELDHLCRWRSCVRPDHLEPVTHRENMRRGSQATAAAARRAA